MLKIGDKIKFLVDKMSCWGEPFIEKGEEYEVEAFKNNMVKLSNTGNVLKMPMMFIVEGIDYEIIGGSND